MTLLKHQNNDKLTQVPQQGIFADTVPYPSPQRIRLGNYSTVQ